jgi:ATP-dependent RNA helicase SUPV3L1/SUV3
MRTQVQRIDKTDGDIDVLSKRLAFIRTWTYAANRTEWLQDAARWRDKTRAVEDRLSDALHSRLTQRFVDRRTSVLMRRLKQKEDLVATVDKDGSVTVEGEHVGRIEGLRFQPDKEAEGVHEKTLRAASTAPVAAELTQRVEKLYAAPDGALDFTEQGGIVWGNVVIGRLEKGADALSPMARVFADELLEATSIERAQRRCQQWIDRKITTQFEPLLAIKNDESITGIGKGVVFQLVEALGVLPRGPVANDVKSIEQDVRAIMRKHGLRFGQYTLFMPLLLKPAPTRLRVMLWGLSQAMDDIPAPPPAGVVTFPAPEGVPHGYFPMAGYRKAGNRALRLDMLERLADMLRPLDARKGFEATPDMLSITGLTLEQFSELMTGMGYRGERAERPKVKPAPKDPAPADETADTAAKLDPVVPEPHTPPALDEVILGDTPAAALDSAPAATAEAAGDTAAVEAVEAELGGIDILVNTETETYYTFRILPRGRQQRGDGPRRKPNEGGNARRSGPPGGDAGAAKPVSTGPGARKSHAQNVGGSGRPNRGKQGGQPGGGKGRRPAKQQPQTFKSAPPKQDRKVDPDSPFAILQRLKDGK